MQGKGGHSSPKLGDKMSRIASERRTQWSGAGRFRHMERIARQRLALRNKKGDKRTQKGDKVDTVTNKKETRPETKGDRREARRTQ